MSARIVSLSLSLVVLAGAIHAAQPADPRAQNPSADARPQTASPDAPAQTASVDPRAQVAARFPGTRPEDVRATPVAGVYELVHGSNIAYITGDGKYAFSGDLIDLAKKDNLTEARRREARVKSIGAIPESEMLVFGPREPKYTVTVFTDVDCAYCRQLHSQIAEYNQLGIRVRYLFYPRTGPNTASWTKAEEVWCSSNRNEALTTAKRGAALMAKACPDNPVARHYALGRDFELQGTPAIVLSNGELIGGYLPPAELAQRLTEVR
jgi:thiol:disulfide interchange protein DsbC